MKNKAILASTLAAFVCVACSSSDGDASAQRPQDSQAQVENAQKQIDSSNMTPEQKKAAADFMKQGAQDAQQMKNSAQGSGGAPN